MNIGIVVLNYNNYQETKRCVNQLISIDAPAQICIVDNNSKNESYTHLSDYFIDKERVNVIQNQTNAGYAAGNNVGIKYLIENYNSDAICILNPDVIISKENFFDNLYKKLMSNDKYALISGICIQNESFNMHYSGWKLPTGMDLIKSRCYLIHTKTRLDLPFKSKVTSEGVIEVGVLVGCCFMIKTTVIKEIGYFDEGTFLYNEENILGWQIKNIGMKEVISIDDYYYHNHQEESAIIHKTFKDKCKLERLYYPSTAYLLSKYYDKKVCMLYEVVHKMNMIHLVLSYAKDKILRR